MITKGGRPAETYPIIPSVTPTLTAATDITQETCFRPATEDVGPFGRKKSQNTIQHPHLSFSLDTAMPPEDMATSTDPIQLETLQPVRAGADGPPPYAREDPQKPDEDPPQYAARPRAGEVTAEGGRVGGGGRMKRTKTVLWATGGMLAIAAMVGVCIWNKKASEGQDPSVG